MKNDIMALTSGMGLTLLGNGRSGTGVMTASNGAQLRGDEGSLKAYSGNFDESMGIEASIDNPIKELSAIVYNLLSGGKKQKVFEATEHTPDGVDLSKVGIRAGARLSFPQYWNTVAGLDIMPPVNSKLNGVNFVDLVPFAEGGQLPYEGYPSENVYYGSLSGPQDMLKDQAFAMASIHGENDYRVVGNQDSLLSMMSLLHLTVAS